MPCSCRLAAHCLAFALCLIASATAAGEAWESPDHPISMQPPEAWIAFAPDVLDLANNQVRHVTGHRFIAGYGLRANSGNMLIFPYLLVQYKPYSDLPKPMRPTHKLDDQGKLLLLDRVVNALKFEPPPTASVDLDAYLAEQASDYIRVTRVDGDGRFDLAGTIPSFEGSDPIHYHTHGVMGREGVALVSLFASEQFEELTPLIDGPMRTLAFDQGAAYADLPDEPPTPDPADADVPPANQQVEPDPASSRAEGDANDRTPTQAQPDPQPKEQAEAGQAPTPDTPDSSTLLIVLGVLGLVAIAVFAIVIFISHKQAEARRERARERRERRQRAAGNL